MMSMSVPGAGAPAPMMMSGASPMAPPQQKMSSLYDKIDTAGAGSITKSQLEVAFQTLKPPAVFQRAGVDSIFGHLDPTRKGSVSKDDFVQGMKNLMVSLRAGG
jgi:Ca2+-binding EF-hand superfamily protein